MNTEELHWGSHLGLVNLPVRRCKKYKRVKDHSTKTPEASAGSYALDQWELKLSGGSFWHGF